jgi:hypothetical protein
MSSTRNKIINESFGSWLNQARQWASGVGQDAMSGTIFDKGEKPAYNTQVQNQLYRAEILQTAIFDAANTIDSVLRSLQGTDLYKRAKESGAEMISFLQQSIKTVQSIISEAGEQEMTNKSKYEKNGALEEGRTKKLDAISEKLDKIIQREGGGALDTWVREFLGKNNEGFESNEYLSTGNALVAKAIEVLVEIKNADDRDFAIAQKDIDKVVKRGLDAIEGVINGKKGSEAVKYKPGSELESIMLVDREAEASKQVPEAVRKFRENLRKLQIETSDEDIWSEKDDPCAEEAATVISSSTKKKYNIKDKKSFKELQRDADSVIKNQKKIKELVKAPKL